MTPFGKSDVLLTSIKAFDQVSDKLPYFMSLRKRQLEAR